MKLYSNSDPSLKMVREFEQRSAPLGNQWLIKKPWGIVKYLEWRKGLATRNQQYVKPLERRWLRQRQSSCWDQSMKNSCWRQGKLRTARWNDASVSTKDCFSWLSKWTLCPSYVVAGMYELYEFLRLTKLYQVKEIKISQSSNVRVLPYV